MYTFNEKEHIHLLNGEPLVGTTTLIKNVMPPHLAKWGATCAVDYIKENRVLLGTEEEDKVFNDATLAYTKVLKKAAKKGTDLHALLEAYVEQSIEKGGKPIENPLTDSEHILKFAEWAVAAVDEFVFAEKYTYSKSMWTGGVVDCFAKMKDGTYAVIDFKSSKEAYFSQFVQAAGYAKQLEESGYGNADGAEWETLKKPIEKLVVVPFGAPVLKPEIIENVKDYQKVFESLAVNVYPYLNSFINNYKK